MVNKRIHNNRASRNLPGSSKRNSPEKIHYHKVTIKNFIFKFA